jgi:hypothetical protein
MEQLSHSIRISNDRTVFEDFYNRNLYVYQYENNYLQMAPTGHLRVMNINHQGVKQTNIIFPRWDPNYEFSNKVKPYANIGNNLYYPKNEIEKNALKYKLQLRARI